VGCARSVVIAASGGFGGTGGVGMVAVMAVVASRASTGGASEGTTNSSWLTLKAIVTLFTAGQTSSLFLEVCHADSGQSRCGVVLGFIVVDFVNGDGGVDNRWLNSLLVDNWLNSFMDVVVDMLASNDWRNGVSFLSATFCSSVLKLRALLLKTCFDGIGIAMLMLSVLDGDDVVGVLFWENFAVLDWLHGGVVMILMYLTINGSLGLLMANFGDFLVHDSWGNLLVYGGIMVTGLVHEVTDCFLRLIHGC